MKEDKKIWSNMTIHIGMPKCASTSLQCNFFSQSDSLQYLGPTSVHFDMTALEKKHAYMLAISCQEEHRYQEIADEIKVFMHNYFDIKQKSLISDESIAHGYYGGVPEACNDRMLVAKRYQEMFPGSKILFVIRNQFQFLESHFGEWNRRVFINYHDFHRWLNECFTLHKGLLSNPLCLPDYYGVYLIYAELFGHENVKVMPLEYLAKDPDMFFTEVADYVGIKMSPDLLQKAKLRLNTRTKKMTKKMAVLDFRYPFLRKLVPSDISRTLLKIVDKLSPELDVHCTRDERMQISRIFGADNVKLEKLTGLPLTKLGYPVIG